MNKQEALEGLRVSHAELTARLTALSPEAWDAPLPAGAWGARDIAIHIAAWDSLLAEAVRALPGGIVPDWLSWDDARTDEVNDRQVREHAGWPRDRLTTLLRDTRGELLDAVAALDDAEFSRAHRSGEIETSGASLCASWIEHDRAHIAELPAVAPDA